MGEATPTERLYGREEEVHRLHAAYLRRTSSAAQKEPELVLITGRSGTGKSTLARMLKNTVVSDGGFFVSGKFDQMQRPEPYAPFVVAFSKLSELITARNEEPLVEIMRERVKGIAGMDTKLLLDTVPSLEKILGSAHTSQTSNLIHNVSETDARKRRFLTSFRGLVRAIASPECPLVLFLDDLQWADKGSLDLLAALAEDSRENEGFMLLGACRGNEVSVDDYLSVTLRTLEVKNVKITDIHISNFARKDVQAIVKTWFPTSEDFETLVELLYDRTDGNIFFLLQLAKRLQDEGILVAEDPGKEWHLDQDRISAIIATKNVVGMVEGVLSRLPRDVKEVLQIASCLGATFRKRHLDIVLPDWDVPAALNVAATRGLVYLKVGGGKFAHDRIQEAAYSSIPPEKRSSVHASIGRKLLNGLTAEEVDQDIFLIVNQVGAGVDGILDPMERNRLADLCLRAGKRAVSSSAFGAAREYLNLGIDFLGPKHWREEYQLSLALFNGAAEVEYCNGNFSKTDSLLDEVFRNARCFDDKVQSYNTRVFALGAQERFSEAIETALKVLKSLGESFPKPTRTRTSIEMLRTKWMLRGMTANDILCLPAMTDTKKLAAQHLMGLVFLYVFFTQQEYVPLLATRFVQRTLQYGLSVPGVGGIGIFAMLLCAHGQIDDAYKYAQFALIACERYHERAWSARFNVTIYGMVIPWKEPVRNTFSPLLDAHRAGCETGDIEFAMLGASLYIFHRQFAGAPMPELLEEAVAFADEMRTFKQEAVLSLMLPLLQMLSNFMGEAEDPFVLTGKYMDESEYILSQETANNRSNVLDIYFMHAEIYYYMNAYDRAANEIKKCWLPAREGKHVSSITAAGAIMFGGLIAAETARKTRERKHYKTACRCRKKLRKWASHSPYNILPYFHLVDAEVAALDGKVDEALIKYGSAVESAKKEGFLQIEALACERAGITLHFYRRERNVKEYLSRARSAYEKWGFRIKVDQLDKTLSGNEQPALPLM